VWSGSVSFGLVTIPVELYGAARPSRVSLRMLGPDGTPLRRRYVCPSDGRVLDDDDIVRGYEVEDGRFVRVTDEQLEQIAPRRSRDIEIERFVDRRALDPTYFLRPFFVVPADGQTKAYRLLVDTMEASKRAAVGRFVLRGKGHAVALIADRGVLRALTLRAADEIRDPARMGIDAPADAERADVTSMRRAVTKLAVDAFDDEPLRDDDADRLLALAKAKATRGEGVVRIEEPPREETMDETDAGAEVIDLFALIQERLRSKAPRSVRRTSRGKSAQERDATRPRVKRSRRGGSRSG
jgi:DNA end-binding protein Ku